ncbi:LLM class flavin-dependent oxidoreductase [Vogesella sp. LIG4]|uniref:LLM class flavin-dependent oxidoreductase n=1 Tax=Vogesella sp. LIG4 TaxID=1192162 RepID=UPI00081FAA3B|nr:LLM class flavin-dependent oxidoreductase [Vogesella sp. LIG4]SCK26677.1 luciferase family oxidoreductase, group 1 [Vogesella sp. LIG4]
MSYSISILEKSPIPEGKTAADALRHSVKLAQRAEELGYHRFWLAEHHGNGQLASVAPEIVAAHILARTSLIRVGTGGVMLQHYSPYKVAEIFRQLAALAPGRVDAGVGKAPGGLPLSTRALQQRHAGPADFEQLLAELDGFLQGPLPAEHPLAGTVATPVLEQAPQRILLGGSPESAALAARHGWDFTFAGHFNGDAANLQATLTTYRQASGKQPALALYAFAANSRTEAEALVGELRIFKLHPERGQAVNLPSLAAAEQYARQAGLHHYHIEELRPHVITGSGEDVRRQLDELHHRYGVREFVIDNPVADFARRLASIELIAGADIAIAA